ncbi:MAG: CDP-alcohol phosphatidyltransferase family protein [Ruminococcus sp.]
MKSGFKISDIYTIPNLMTLLRIVLIGPFMFFFLNKNYIAAAVSVILSGITDALDGFIARRFNQITALGKILDPIADKLTLFAIMICVTIYSPVVLPVMVVLIIKDLLMLIGGSILLKNNLTPPQARWYGKVSTFVFYVVVSLIVFLKAAFNYQNDILSLVLLSVTTVLMLFSLFMYFLVFLSLMKNKNR